MPISLRISLRRHSRAATLIGLSALGLALTAPAPADAASAPPTPIYLFSAYQACSTDATSPSYLFESGAGIALEGQTNPADTPFLTEQFQLWPVSDPAQVTQLSDTSAFPRSAGSVAVPSADLVEGQAYAWQAQVVDAEGASPWSATCYFTVDNTPPSSAPTITSANYPAGQVDQGGARIQFTLGANGAADVAGYEFSWQQDLPLPRLGIVDSNGVPQASDPFADTTLFVRAPSLGGSATLSLLPPEGFGPQTLFVRSLDRAFNLSPIATYGFFIKGSATTLTPLVPSPKFGQQMEFLLRPDPSLQAISPIVSYTVQVLDSTRQTFTVRASSDGTAEVAFKLDGANGDSISVSSTSADGWVGGGAFWSTFFDTTPTVSSDVYLEGQSSGGVGIPGTFTFAPKVKGIVSYTYSVNDGTPVTVPAGPDGTAQITFTPDQSGGFYDLNVYGTTRDGVQLAAYDYIFFTN